jgi:DNA-binding CsgD family transcriptional regulator/tetratricopeptide (TPR) repeat protein
MGEGVEASRQLNPSSSSSGTVGDLLERAEQLTVLAELLRGIAETGRGRVVLVSGEAGAGKTVFVRRFCETGGSSARTLWGACDPLFTPRPLGPLLDVAEVTGGELARLVEAEARPHEVMTALKSELRRRGVTILVLEDVHWADQATLDVLRLLGRRIETVPALVVATYRDDQVDRWHPLRVVLGEIGAGRPITRIPLAPLSLQAVAKLAERSGANPHELHRRTGGNAFFVTEVLAEGGDVIPPTVSDAVLARVARLSPRAQRLLEAVATLPGHAELWLLQRLSDDCIESLDECIASGIVTLASGSLLFRHEVARLAMEATISDPRKADLHRAAIVVLADPPVGEVDLTRLAHHADAAADAAAVIRFAPAAAARASKLGAHREAAMHYSSALRFADQNPLPSRARLYEGEAYECYLTTQFDAAARAQQHALTCHTELGDQRKRGGALRWLSQIVWQTGALDEAQRLALQAVVILEQLPHGPDLALAYTQVSQLLLASENPGEAMGWARRAMRLAEQPGNNRAYIAALRAVAWVEFFTGTPGGLENLEHCRDLAESAGLEADVAGTIVVIARTAARRRLYDIAEHYVDVGLEYCSRRDLDVWHYYLVGWQAKIELARGRWDDAARSAGIALAEHCPFARIHALVALGLLRARRGDPDPWTPLDEALRLAEPRRELQWIAPVAMARAEAAWLEGRNDEALSATNDAFDFSQRLHTSWTTGLAYWRWRAGADTSGDEIGGRPDGADDPHVMEMAGEWALAAERWAEMSCPYEAALALSTADDEPALRRALIELQDLGARPAARIVARRLRESGAGSVPRGPRPATRRNPANLTQRQLEVIALLTQDLHNREIAQRLFLSEKTVDHHVSAILAKLDVRTRAQAVGEARRLGFAGDDA